MQNEISSRPSRPDISKILIVKTSAIGDVTHTLPALNALRKRYPDASITWLVEEAAADVVRGHKALDRLLVSGRKRWSKELRSRKFFSALSEIRNFIRALRDTRYDLLIDFQGLLKSGIFVALARAERKVGFGRGMEHAEGSWIFLNEPIPAVDMNIHALDRELKLLEAIGVPCDEVRFDFPISDKDEEAVTSLLREKGVDLEKPLAALNPQATWPTKLWDSKKFSEVADRLCDLGVSVVFTGSKADHPEVEKILKMMRRPAANFCGKTSLKELAALYKKAGVLVTTDTGPMHIAASVGTPVVAVFGSTAPWRTGPYGEAHQVVRVEVDCGPCLKKECDNRQCMERVSVDMVMVAVLKVPGIKHA